MLIMILLFLLFIGYWWGQVQDCMQSCFDFINENFDVKVEEETENDLRLSANNMEIAAGELTYFITMNDVSLDA